MGQSQVRALYKALLLVYGLCSLYAPSTGAEQIVIQAVNEKVSVIASYSQPSGRVAPRRLRWRGRTLALTKLGLYHPVREGRRLYRVLSVSDGVTDYQLKLDTETLHWELEETSDGLAA